MNSRDSVIPLPEHELIAVGNQGGCAELEVAMHVNLGLRDAEGAQ